MTTDQIFFDRYSSRKFVDTDLNPLDDVFDWIRGFRSVSTLSDLAGSHSALRALSNVNRRERLENVSSHIGAAVQYLETAAVVPDLFSFLPAYYGLLNLAKAAVLFGRHATDLRTQRYHGLSYEPFLNPTNLMADRIMIHKHGVIPLLYRTLTGSELVQSSIRLDSAYRYIVGISYEYSVLSGKHLPISLASISLEPVDLKFRVVAKIADQPSFASISTYRVPAFSGLRRVLGEDLVWQSRLFSAPTERDAVTQGRQLYTPYLLMHQPASTTPENQPHTSALVAWSNLSYDPIEEINLLLAFFHMSSVVRYDPIYADRLQESSALPLLLALRRHGLYKYLILVFSFITQTRVSILRN